MRSAEKKRRSAQEVAAQAEEERAQIACERRDALDEKNRANQETRAVLSRRLAHLMAAVVQAGRVPMYRGLEFLEEHKPGSELKTEWNS
ncbi:hypothetical protein F511_19618 [Dorcoceras hygrometricum]|uniref:Uncharacterized protein n=1 Tax=Dorcoceras hygrometricum TaxID=472368 RepID=A0A2Z7D0N9_9LAMI|nr:hypothetical protein F511_19618 [Dorcoceras hygrometricum]